MKYENVLNNTPDTLKSVQKNSKILGKLIADNYSSVEWYKSSKRPYANYRFGIVKVDTPFHDIEYIVFLKSYETITAILGIGNENIYTYYFGYYSTSSTRHAIDFLNQFAPSLNRFLFLNQDKENGLLIISHTIMTEISGRMEWYQNNAKDYGLCCKNGKINYDERTRERMFY